MKKLIIEVDDYKLESCERRAAEGLNAWYHDLILNAKPLETELEEIKAEMDEYKEFQDGHFIDASEMKCALMYIINTHICKLKGENNEN